MTDGPAVGAAPSREEAVGWLGFELDDVAGRRCGRLHGLFVDAATGEPVWLVAELGRRIPLLGGRGGLVALPARDCAGAAGRAWTAQSREQLQGAPTVDPRRPLLREHELTLCAHYGIGERVGRAAEVAGRPAGAVTARPDVDVP